MSEPKLEILATFENAIDAEIVRGRLESDGIACHVLDGGIVGMNWTLSNAVGGVKLVVRAEDLENARALINDNESISNEDEGWGACPSCGSRKLGLFFERRITNLTWILVGIPLLFPSKKFRCLACHEITVSPIEGDRGG